ncbi:unnamed protein product [Clonostachys chloroleuca]|uniref:Uncharacterized protein n=1 Tax=Clonostachys chloroleuca TaxID=1926264 RepID=A0AA35MIE4_9HYPO|nr:unnamed protein product [Clonostachys chloroleuca]
MSMYRGGCANYAIVDVLDFVDSVGPKLINENAGCDSLTESLMPTNVLSLTAPNLAYWRLARHYE